MTYLKRKQKGDQKQKRINRGRKQNKEETDKQKRVGWKRQREEKNRKEQKEQITIDFEFLD